MEAVDDTPSDLRGERVKPRVVQQAMQRSHEFAANLLRREGFGHLIFPRLVARFDDRQRQRIAKGCFQRVRRDGFGVEFRQVGECANGYLS